MHASPSVTTSRNPVPSVTITPQVSRSAFRTACSSTLWHMTDLTSHLVMGMITEAQTRILVNLGDGNLEIRDEPPLA